MKAWSRVIERQSIVTAFAVILLGSIPMGCGAMKAKEAAPAAKAAAPAKVEKMPGEADLTTITLTPEAETRLRIKTVAIEAKDVTPTRVVGGEIIVPPGRTLIVSSPIAGTLYAPPGGIPVAGTTVKPGQVIFNLIPLLSAESRATFATTKVEAEGQIDQAQKQLAQAKLVLDRTERLRSQNLGGGGAVEDAKSAFDVAEAALKAATTRRDAINQAIKGSEGGTLEPVAIAAQGGGILRNLHVAPGQKVAPGTMLFEVVDLNPIHVRTAVYVGDLTKIEGALPAEIGELAGLPGGLTRKGRRVVDPPSGDPIAATVDVFYEIENKDSAFHPGQRVGVSLPLKGNKAGLIVPRAALLRDIDGGSWVYEDLGKHKYARRRVRVEAVSGELANLSAGPKAGIKVVTDGAAELFGVEFGGSK
jgi:RND family efflux transporter MFP subunit